MKKSLISVLCAVGFGAGVSMSAHALDLSSTDIANGKTLTSAQVFEGFGCTGGNVSPALSWSNVPAGTKSFAITAYDPDAPTGSGWWHWTAYDLPAALRSLPSGAGKAGALPAGAKHGRNDYGSQEFGGACPPPGDKPHRYIFTVFALGVDKLEVPADASAALIGYMLNANKLGTASITARFGR
ncbi:YbhB/YbcL family Raf kinase inhibitor-like protein [Rhodoferax aquaticus]|uniref:YbhB/YbcL family Raf kinase inhibitor-like protein n=1 Tax=Rhodoferax aquaticus TaxID=2527691 RepID=A0A515ER90_9BURK|nr:YbhB/YbcL family Raf kinase inhibitor-like protein [Rhodoferax aquaticus]QDL55143.1 YbhB/YbcL family Raf kinase inhibitor-like protein [Rhodoferax aquaticus]